MASQDNSVLENLDLDASSSDIERGEKFWNSSVVSMKFTVERQWLKRVRKARRKPNYGMCGMDSKLEEIIGNKLELAGPLIVCYLREIGKSLRVKLSMSKATGLVNTITLFVPWPAFRLIMTLLRGYSEDIHTKRDGSKHFVTITKMDTINKLFSPARFTGETFFAYRHFKKSKSAEPGKKMVSTYNGRSAIVVSELTPFCIDYPL